VKKPFQALAIDQGAAILVTRVHQHWPRGGDGTRFFENRVVCLLPFGKNDMKDSAPTSTGTTMMKTVALRLGVVVACLSALVSHALAQRPAKEQPLVTAKNLEMVHRIIRPWLLSVWEAREKAAKGGKPILVWSGSGGAPIGVC
jgi:hypothetical protein